MEGATSSIVFEVYIQKVLVPSLRRRQVVVMDNLSAHKGGRVRELVESAGCELLSLPPPYSRRTSTPSKRLSRRLKAFLRKAEARSGKALVEAIGKALDAVSTRDARAFFEHCGYRSLGQLL